MNARFYHWYRIPFHVGRLYRSCSLIRLPCERLFGDVDFWREKNVPSPPFLYNETKTTSIGAQFFIQGRSSRNLEIVAFAVSLQPNH